MSSHEEAAKIFDALNGKKVDGFTLRTYYPPPRFPKKSRKTKRDGKWKEKTIVFEMDFENINDRHQRLIHIHEFIKKNTEKSAIAARMHGDNKVVATFGSEDVAKGCREKINCMERCSQMMRIMFNAYSEIHQFPYSGVKVYGMNEKTTIQQLIDYTNKRGDIVIEKGDIYVIKHDEHKYVRITCSSDENAY